MISGERALGFAETRMHAMHSVLNGTTQGIASVAVSGPLVPILLEEAIAHVHRKYDILRAKIDLRESSYFFSVTQRLPLVEWITENSWQTRFQQLNSQVLDTERGLWKAIVVRPELLDEQWHFIVVAHHAVVDGHAMSQLLAQIFESYSRLLSNEPDAIVSTAPRAIPAAAESMVPLCYQWSEFAQRQKQVLDDALPLDVPRFHASAALNDRLTRTCFFSLSSELIATIEAGLKKHDLTFNSWVSAEFLLATQRHSGRDNFGLFTAFSLRNLCQNLEEEDLGCYLSVIPTFHSVANRTVLDLASEHRKHLTKAIIRHGRHPKTVDARALRAGLQPLADADRFIHDLAFTYAESTLAHRYGRIRIDSFHLSANRSLGTTSLVLHGVRHNGATHFTMNWTAPLQDDTWARLVAEELNARLLNCPF